jgi:xanthine dehydrogenase large subunit
MNRNHEKLVKMNRDVQDHVQGKSRFIDDFPELDGTLHGVAITSPVAHGIIISTDYKEVESSIGVIKVFTHKDITGQNQIGPIIPDEPLFAEKEVHFIGQVIAFVVADSIDNARRATKKAQIEIEELPVITDPIAAWDKGSFIIPPRVFQMGDTDSAFHQCIHIAEGQAETGAQEHLYMETQGAYAWPTENNSIRILSSTQGPSVVQRITARVLGVPMHLIEVDVVRIGGGFGGKEDQATIWATLCALAAQNLQQPVKYMLSRSEDLRYTGKRHPYKYRYKLGLDNEMMIKAWEVEFFQNAGASADLSPAILERTLLHANNAYNIPNLKTTAWSCKTNLPPNTAFRGFGAPQAMFAIESAIDQIAQEINVDRQVIQRKNLLKNGDLFYYGQIAEDCQAIPCWDKGVELFKFNEVKSNIDQYNATHKLKKKGFALMPVCFGISFTNTSMNHGHALVHVYQDGSVGVSTGAVEMGQGVNAKILQIAAETFSISPEKIKVESTNTTRIANASPSAASSTTDLNGHALIHAIEQIKGRLIIHAAELLKSKSNKIHLEDDWIRIGNEKTELHWEQLILSAFLARIDLSAKGHYARPIIHFDKSTEQGHPFAYHVNGTALVEVSLDCLRGTYTIDAVRVVHDFGSSMNRIIDLGQMEGGILQGIGWMTMEEIKYSEDGRLLADALSTYKVPDLDSTPKEIDVHFLKTDGNEQAVLKGKAVGEPPFMYGIGAYFALLYAIRAFNPKFKGKYDAPLTPEKTIFALYDN